MVLRNRRDKCAKHSRSGGELEPCRQPVDARDAKAALKAFIAACGKAAAVTTIAVAAGSVHVSCHGDPEARSELAAGEVTLTQITTQPVHQRLPGAPLPAELTTQPAALPGKPLSMELTTHPDQECDTEALFLEGEPAAIIITTRGEAVAAEITTQPAEDDDSDL